jgi:hypothetical protein
LRVTARQFWLAVDKGEAPRREPPGAQSPRAATIPLKAFLRLRSMGYSDAEIRALSRSEIERLTQEDRE